jgi:hypothetical protein
MTDWNKQKVPELKAELKKRGLPQTGLKADLVARLTTADNESGFESETTVKGDTVETVQDSTKSADAVIEDNNGSVEIPAEESGRHQTPPPDSAALPTSISSDSKETVLSDATPEIQSQPLSSRDIEAPKPTELGNGASPTLPSVDSQELIEDRQKRKRRSKSPPPSTNDIRRKRARADEESPPPPSVVGATQEGVLTTRSGVEGVERQNSMDIEMVNTQTGQIISETVVEQDSTTLETLEDNVDSNPQFHAKHHTITSYDQLEGTTIEVEDTQEKPSPALPSDMISPNRTKDTRFKDLFPAQPSKSGQETSLDKSSNHMSVNDRDIEPVDRFVTPSIHPATSALYIRDFMRPLNAATLKEHLNILATAPGASPDQDTIVDFYLDPIRTHAFISFKSVSAASRVRSELHDQIWPEERTRKPLWADFIPQEKVLEWIAEEQSSSSGGRSSGKKWEVAYDIDADGNVTPVLHESGSLPPPVRKPSVAAAPVPVISRSGIEGAPSGPRAQQISSARATSTLNRLFKSTTAKPVLYYQPVAKELAEKRLDHIEDATSKNYSGREGAPEINRYTFEDRDTLVDRGPEIFSGIRPPPGYRGRGGGGGGGGRGGGGGGGGYRGRGGDRYERNVREARDYGRDSRDRRY